jgi:hypothetical protein
MMLLGIPLAIWLGLLAITLLFATLFLGVAMMHGKASLKYHKAFAFATGAAALVHLVFAVLLWFYGVMV